MLTADTQLDVGAGLFAQLDRRLHQLADTLLVEPCEGIGLIDLLV